MAKYYHFHQNNSGGSFVTDIPNGLGINMFIEAGSAKEANVRAESVGIYFNGVAEDRDCECCGDRWSPAWEDSPEELPTDGYYTKLAFVHFKDGTFKLLEEVVNG